MISLPNLLKFYSKKNKVEQYDFNEYMEEAKIAKSEKAETEQELEIQEGGFLPEFLSEDARQ